MNRITLFLLVIAIQGGVLRTNAQSCSYSGGSCTEGLSDPAQIAINVVADVCSILNIQYISIYAGDVGNACASNFMGSPVITYNPQFLAFLYDNNSWAPVSVLAHEVGHHLFADPTWYGSFTHSWTKELRSDYVSGYVLYKLGASLFDAQSAFRVMFDWLGSTTHPDTPKRMAALEQGWRRAQMGF